MNVYLIIHCYGKTHSYQLYTVYKKVQMKYNLTFFMNSRFQTYSIIQVTQKNAVTVDFNKAQLTDSQKI